MKISKIVLSLCAIGSVFGLSGYASVQGTGSIYRAQGDNRVQPNVSAYRPSYQQLGSTPTLSNTPGSFHQDALNGGYTQGTIYKDATSGGYNFGTVYQNEGYTPGVMYNDLQDGGYHPGTMYYDAVQGGYTPGTVYQGNASDNLGWDLSGVSENSSTIAPAYQYPIYK